MSVGLGSTSAEVLFARRGESGALIACAPPASAEGSTMSTTTTPAVRLPPISEVDRADEKLGSFKSDLDSIRSQTKVFAGNDVSLEDATFLSKTGVEFAERPRSTDPATIARLLVFADEVLDDVEDIREDAKKLRQDLLWAYRMFVIEPSGRRRDA